MIWLRNNIFFLLWMLAGLMVVSFCIGTSHLSHQFIYGVGHSERPIPIFLAFYATGCLALTIATILVRLRRNSKYTFIWIVVIGIAARIFLLDSNLIQENDCYRYVLDGECMVNCVNPYAYAPGEIIEKAPIRLQAELQGATAQLIISRIGYPEVPTIYPPLAQLCFAAGVVMTPWDWHGQRFVFLLLDISTIFLMILLLKRLQKPLSWCVIYAWNPLVLKEIANSAHLDSLVGFCIILLLLLLEKWNRKKNFLIAACAGLSLGAAVLAKLYPIILIPVCVAYLINPFQDNMKKGWIKLTGFATGLFGLIIISYIPFLGIGIQRVSEGLRTYNAEWVNNDGAFFIISCLTDFFSDTDSFPIARLVAHGLTGLLGLIMAVNVYRSENLFESLINAFQIILLGWLLLLPAVFPWYAVGIIAVCVGKPRGLIVLLSSMLGLYYLLFLVDYRDYSAKWRTIIQLSEHGLIWVGVFYSLFKKFRVQFFPFGINKGSG